MLNRRDFIHSGCAIAAATLAPNPIEARILRGSIAAVSNNPNRTVLNVGPIAWANIWKSFTFNIPIANQDANGYPNVGTLAQNASCNPQFLIGVFPDYIVSCGGTPALGFFMSCACLIRLQQVGGVNTSAVVSSVTGTGANFAGDTGGNTTITNNKNNYRIQFAPGALIQSISDSIISNGSGGTYIKVTFKAGFVNAFSGSDQAATRVIKIQNSAQSGGGNVQVAGAIDTWNYTVIDANSIYLTTSTTTNLPSAFTTGSATPGGEALTTPNNLSVAILAGTYTNTANAVLCTVANETAVNNGQINDPALVAQYQYLMNHAGAPFGQRGILRFMDDSGVQGSFEQDFGNRLASSAMVYNSTNYFSKAYAAVITNGGSDAFTCSDTTQTVWDSTNSRYFDGAIVQGTLDIANKTANPTLNVGSHVAAPIFDATPIPNKFLIFYAPGSATITGGSYNNTTGQVTLTLDAAIRGGTLAAGHAVQVLALQGTGANLGSLNGQYTSIAASTGTTVNYTIAAGLDPGGTIIINGGYFSDITAGGGQTMQWTFAAPGWTSPTLAGTPYTVTYTTSAGASFTGTTSGSSTSLTVSGMGAGQSIAPGQTININGLSGPYVIMSQTSGTTGGNGVYVLSQAINLGGNTCTVNADTLPFSVNGVPTLTNFFSNLVNFFAADPVLAAAKIVFGNSGIVTAYPRTVQDGALTITYTSGPVICTMGRLNAAVTATSGSYNSTTGALTLNFAAPGPIGWLFSPQTGTPYQVSGLTGSGAGLSQLNATWGIASFTATSVTLNVITGLTVTSITGGVVGDGGLTLPGNSNNSATFVYNAVIGGWIYRPGGLVVSIPFEAIVEFCNLTGSHCWYNWPVYTKAAFITAATSFVGDATTGLTSGLRFMTEFGNELWNFGAGCFGRCMAYGFAMGFANGSENPLWSWGAMRVIQYGSLSKAAWAAKGRTSSDHYTLLIGRSSEAFIGNQGFTNSALNGSSLVLSNTIYSRYGGMAGAPSPFNAAADYSTVGNRPADGKDANGLAYVTASGMACYWFSDYIREDTAEIFGPISDNAIWAQASKDYANGNTASAFSAMASMFTTQRGSAAITSGSYDTVTGKVTLTLASPINIAATIAPGHTINFFNLTGSGLSNINQQQGYSSISPTSGTTVTFAISSGLGVNAVVINGGTFIDQTASNVNPITASNFVEQNLLFQNFEAIVGAYDSQRQSSGLNKLGILHYEAAPQWCVNASPINGTNGTGLQGPGGNPWYIDLSNQIIGNLGWNVSAYTVSGTNTVNEFSNQVVNLVQGWKLDITNAGAAANTGSYKSMIKTNYYQALVNASAGKSREVRPAQFGYQGNIWGLFAISYLQANGRYTNYDAMREFNA